MSRKTIRWRLNYHYAQGRGLCPRCKGPRDRADRKLCEKCRRYFVAATALKVARRLQKGLCPQCGHKPEAPAQTHGMCVECYGANLIRRSGSHAFD